MMPQLTKIDPLGGDGETVLSQCSAIEWTTQGERVSRPVAKMPAVEHEVAAGHVLKRERFSARVGNGSVSDVGANPACNLTTG